MSGYRARCAQRGMVLISSLLLLLVVTIIALSMFRSFGIQEKIAGNIREKQRALSAAVLAEEYAENWLDNGANSTSAAVDCSSLLNANVGQGQICSNKLPLVVTDLTNVPWTIAGVPVGVSYLPLTMQVSTTTAVPTSQTLATTRRPPFTSPIWVRPPTRPFPVKSTRSMRSDMAATPPQWPRSRALTPCIRARATGPYDEH
jgi:hypothetical protein